MHKTIIILISTFIITGLVFPYTLSAQLMNSPWPMFRHDIEHTGRSEYSGPEFPQLSRGSKQDGNESQPVYLSLGRNIAGQHGLRFQAMAGR